MPSLESALAEFGLGQGLNDFFGGASLASPEGWISAEVFSIFAPGAVVALALIDGGRSIAAEEEDRLVGLLASNPIGRAMMLSHKSIAIVIHVAIASFLIGLFTWGGVAVFSIDMPAANVWAATIHLVFLGIMFTGAIALVTAATGKRMRSIVITGTIAAVSYIVASLLPVSPDLAGWAKISPWFYYWGDNPLVRGVNWVYIGVMASIAGGLFAAAGYVFTRRDLPG
ncbi:MAG: hypothetical protein O3B42_00905 [Actinomycetota bacterium]|nr:hypothetical protein [Actinomycetota bacterium]